MGLFDLGWVLFVNVVGYGLVVAVVLWLSRQFGSCGGDYWVVVVVIFWVVVDFFFFFSGCVFFFFKVPLVDVVPVVVDVGVVAAVVEELLLPLLLKFNIIF